MIERELHSQRAAHDRAGDGRLRDVLQAEKLGDDIGPRVHLVLDERLRRLADAEEIDGEHAIVFRELGEVLRPCVRVPSEVAEKDERASAAGFVVDDVLPEDGDVLCGNGKMSEDDRPWRAGGDSAGGEEAEEKEGGGSKTHARC